MSRLQPIPSSTEALRQLDEFFMVTSPVHKTLRAVARRLSAKQIDYAIIGGMALALHVRDEYLRLWALAQKAREDEKESNE